ncbi:hypothetical protein VTN02DRAFT_6191 [Thermoascus thermophilus]
MRRVDSCFGFGIRDVPGGGRKFRRGGVVGERAGRTRRRRSERVPALEAGITRAGLFLEDTARELSFRASSFPLAAGRDRVRRPAESGRPLPVPPPQRALGARAGDLGIPARRPAARGDEAGFGRAGQPLPTAAVWLLGAKRVSTPSLCQQHPSRAGPASCPDQASREGNAEETSRVAGTPEKTTRPVEGAAYAVAGSTSSGGGRGSRRGSRRAGRWRGCVWAARAGGEALRAARRTTEIVLQQPGSWSCYDGLPNPACSQAVQRPPNAPPGRTVQTVAGGGLHPVDQPAPPRAESSHGDSNESSLDVCTSRSEVGQWMATDAADIHRPDDAVQLAENERGWSRG